MGFLPETLNTPICPKASCVLAAFSTFFNSTEGLETFLQITTRFKLEIIEPEWCETNPSVLLKNVEKAARTHDA
ncbi:MAG: hypothetical protein AAFR61_32530, partial [Bacteroidota bacterium]